MNLNRLRMLSEIAGRGSFRAAAMALDYSPSAVSQQIALLEREAGVRLVQRGPRGAELTDAGRLLVRHADVALRELAKARRALDALSGNGSAAAPRGGVPDRHRHDRRPRGPRLRGVRSSTPSRRGRAPCWPPARSTRRCSTSSSPAGLAA